MEAPPRVLLVEDDQEILLLLRRVFVREHFEVELANNGREALEKITPEGFDAIILDWFMPGYGGADFLAALKVLHPELMSRILIVTGAVTSRLDDVPEGLERQLIQKPFDIGDLVKLVHARREERAGSPETGDHSTALERLGILLEADCKRIGASNGLVTRVSPDGKTLDWLVIFGYPSEEMSQFFPMTLDARIPIARCVSLNRPLWLSSIAEARADFPNLSTVWDKTKNQALVALPLVVDAAAGSVGWAFRHAQRFDARFQDIATRVANRYRLIVSEVSRSNAR